MMKKSLSLLALALMALTAWSATVTFTPQTVHNSTGDPNVNTLYLDGVTISCTACTFTRTDHYRFNAFSTTTFSSTVGRITKVVITCTGTPGNSHAPDLFEGEGYSYNSYGSYDGTWTGLADSFTLYASAQVRATKIVVTIEDQVGEDVAAPVFYPNGGQFVDSLQVHLSCATPDAQIHYVEGSEETGFDWSTEAVYEGPFFIKSSKTLTAWSTLGESSSTYATATFTRVPHTVAAPVFLPTTPLFSGSQEVTINCSDSTATIYYSYDQEQWIEYAGPFTIDTDVTLYAKAVVEMPPFGPVESEVITTSYVRIDSGDGYPVVFNYGNDPGFETGAPYTVTRPGVSFTVTNGSINRSYRIYKNEKIIFTATQGNIKKIRFVCTNYYDDEYGPGCLTLDEGQDGTYTCIVPENYYYYYSNGNNGIWQGNSPQVSFTASKAQVRCTSIIVYLDTEPTGQEVAAPVISPDMDTIYIYRQEVTITCATPGATIYYSADNENWNEYTGPFDVTEDCIIYAYAELDGNFSAVSVCTFKMATEVDNIGEANALREHTRFAFNGEVIVTYQNEGQTWIKDDSGYGLIYDWNVPEFPQGTVLKGGWDAERHDFYIVPEYQDVHNVEATGEIVTVTPTEYTTVTKDNINEYVLMKNQTLSNITYYTDTWVNQDGMLFYDRFDNIELNIEGGKTYDVVGIVAYHYKSVEIYVISATEVIEWQLGDVNHDHDVDVNDVTAIISHILGSTPENFYLTEANVDGDALGDIDVNDVTALIALILSAQ